MISLSKWAYTVFTTAILWLGSGMAGMAQFKPQSKFQELDDRIMINLSDNRTPEQTKVLLFMSRTNLYGNALVPTGLLAGGIIGNNKEMRENALYIASSSLISYGTVMLIKTIFKRPRPYRNNPRIIAVYPAGGYSFPSGHASSSIGTATALSIAYPKWYVIAPSFLWAGTVSYSRMYMGLHYPTDVTTGALFGAGTAVYFRAIKKSL